LAQPSLFAQLAIFVQQPKSTPAHLPVHLRLKYFQVMLAVAHLYMKKLMLTSVYYPKINPPLPIKNKKNNITHPAL
jgi:hypothetical protein